MYFTVMKGLPYYLNGSRAYPVVFEKDGFNVDFDKVKKVSDCPVYSFQEMKARFPILFVPRGMEETENDEGKQE